MTAVTILGVVVAVLLAVVTRLIVDELVAWVPLLTRRITDIAVGRVPPEHRERYREEWAAELDAFGDRKLAALAWAVRVLVRSPAMRAELDVGASEGDLNPEPPPPPSVVEVDVELPYEVFGRVGAAAHARLTERASFLRAAEQFVAALLERTRPPTWDEIRATMGDPAELDVGDSLDDAACRFERLLSDHRPLD